MTLPSEQICERNLCQDNESEIDVDKNSQQKEEKAEDIQQKDPRPIRQISAPKWTQDYIMEGSETYGESSTEINGIINKAESS